MKNLRSLLVCLALMILAGPVKAQWVSYGPFGGVMIDLKKNGPVYAATDNGVFKSVNHGGSWTAANTGMQRTSISSIVFNGSDNIFSAARGEGIFFSTNGGSSWILKNNGLGDFNIITLFSTNTGNSSSGMTRVFVATSSGVYRSSDNGNSWSPANNGIPSTYPIYSWVKTNGGIPGNNDTIYGGTYGLGLYRTTDYGVSWTAVGGGFPPFTFVYTMASIGSNTLFAATNAGVYISIDGGNTWVSSNTGFPVNTNCFSFTERIGPSHFIFAGTFSDGVFVSLDGGNSWMPKNNGLYDWPGSLPHNYQPVNAMSASGPGTASVNILAATSEGMYRSADNGSMWAEADEGILATDVRGIATNGTVVVTATNRSGVHISTNHGLNWMKRNVGLTNPNIIATVTKGPYILVSGFNNKVLRSVDNGITWVLAANGLSREPFVMRSDNIRILAITQGFIATPVKLFQTVNNGDNWTEIPINPVSGAPSALGINGSRIYLGTFSGNLYRTSNDGQSWKDISEYLPVVKISAILALDSVMFVGTSGKGIFRFTNNDKSVSTVNSGMASYNITDIIMQNGILYTSTWGGGVYISTDLGGNWTAFNGNLSNPYVTQLAGEANNIYAATDAGVYQTLTSEVALFAELHKHTSNSEIEIYPNPGKGKIYLMGLPPQSVRIQIHSLLGSTVFAFEGELPGKDYIDFSEQLPGVYLISIQGQNFSFTKKLILE
jgi:photosystem II stability/assembly factor-like uncharacterized protein